MHRTEGTNNVANLFTDGPPGTTVEEDWLNAIQEEICKVIENAGYPLKTAGADTRDQLARAIFGHYVDYEEADQGLAGNGKTIKSYVDEIGSKKATLVLKHNSGETTTPYTLTTPETISSNITLKIEDGAIIDGAGTLTINGPFEHDLSQCFGSSITVRFGAGSVKEVYPEWWGENTTPGTTDMSAEFQSAITALPDPGGIVQLSATTYRIDTSLTFPIGRVVADYISNVTIQGAGSGLAAGGAATGYGTRIDSYIDGGAVFNLHTGNPTCVGVQFKDFEMYDREATGVNYGIHAYNFQTGSIIENVGTKAFSYGVYISNYEYYSKFDRVVSLYARVEGIHLVNPNMVTLRDVQCSSSDGIGLQIIGSHGVSIIGGFFEGNATYGIHISGASLKGTSIIGAYLEGNGAAGICVGGTGVNYSYGGLIAGNYQPDGGVDGVSISLGYAANVTVIGNHCGAYFNNRCIYSEHAKDCTFIGNEYNSNATHALDVPTNNMILETAFGTRTYEEAISADGALKVFGVSNIDSSGGVLALTLGSAKYIGERKTIVMSVAGNNADVTIAHHETEDDEVARFDAVDEYLILVWTGTEWATVSNSCTFP